MRTRPKTLRFYLEKVVPRKTLPALAKETGIGIEKLEKALREEVDFSDEELRKLGEALGISPWELTVEPEYVDIPEDPDRFDFRQLARTRREGKVVWFHIFPESDGCGIVDTPHTGLHYIKDPLSPVVQCTGLKDTRGVPIWEGDIVEIWNTDTRIAVEVVWIEDKASFGYKSLFRKKESVSPICIANTYLTNPKVIGNKFIAPLELYSKLAKRSWELEIDETTSLRSVIYTGRKRPDGDDIVLYLERDWDTEKVYLADLGETDMFIATHKDLEESREFRVEVNEEDVLEKMEKLLEEIEERFEKELGEFRFGG